jgi:peptidoglycan biosynthesis protein MviN/MurJ (putative lipid II flippase)
LCAALAPWFGVAGIGAAFAASFSLGALLSAAAVERRAKAGNAGRLWSGRIAAAIGLAVMVGLAARLCEAAAAAQLFPGARWARAACVFAIAMALAAAVLMRLHINMKSNHE